MRKVGKTATGENLWGGASDRPTVTGNDRRLPAKFPDEVRR
ncbi:hypothetical protein PSEUDT2_04171 [Stutzerimonas stutzeri]|nr:hypothetical protein PSEUDT2_04171 [Stutzerimonas stutzeri]